MSIAPLIAAVFWLLLQPFPTAAQSNVSSVVLKDRAAAVVRIDVVGADGRSRVASGFIWSSEDVVVTAYHAVASGRPIGVHYAQLQSGGYSPARVLKVAPDYDLALLKLDRPRKVEPLQLARDRSTVDLELTVVGYPLGSADLQSHTLKKRVVAPQALRGLVGRHASEIDAFGAPSLDQIVIPVEGGLLPGYSGAPVFDSKGDVVGIGNGGLKGGMADWGWLIPAARLLESDRFRPLDESSRQLADPLWLFFGASTELPEYEIKPTLAKASLGVAIDATRSVFANYFTRIDKLYREHRHDRTFQNLTDGFEPLAETSIFNIRRDAPIGFRTDERSVDNSEYLAYAALSTLEFYISCYSQAEVEKRLIGDKTSPDIYFWIRSDLFQYPSNFTYARLLHDRKTIDFVIQDYPIDRPLYIKPGFKNGGLLFGGGCEVSSKFQMPRGTPQRIVDELQIVIEEGRPELIIDFGSGARVKLKPASVANVGRLRDNRKILFASFPEFPGEKGDKR